MDEAEEMVEDEDEDDDDGDGEAAEEDTGLIGPKTNGVEVEDIGQLVI